MLQPVKKEGREDGEAGLGGEPEIDFRIQDVQYFFLWNMALKIGGLIHIKVQKVLNICFTA